MSTSSAVPCYETLGKLLYLSELVSLPADWASGDHFLSLHAKYCILPLLSCFVFPRAFIISQIFI